MQKKLVLGLVGAAFVAGAVLTALFAAWLAAQRAAPRIGSTATVVRQIQTLTDLVTVKFVMQKVIIFTNASTSTLSQIPNVMKVPGFSEDRLTLLAHGVAKAGVNLSKLEAGDVEVSGERIIVRLPPATVTDVYLDETQTQLLDRQTGLFRGFEPRLEQQARQFARSEMSRAARQEGIEREAEQRAVEQLQRLLRSLGFKQVEVRSR